MKQRVTMKNIADALGVSINAVSLALNDRSGIGKETRNRILDKADEIGYFDEKSKYKKSFANKNICIFIKAQYFRNSDFYSKVLLGVESEAKKEGYEVLVTFADELSDIPDCIKEGRVCGVITIGRISDEYLVKLKEHGLPLVVVDHSSMTEPADCILSNNKLGSYRITRLLIDSGYTRIGFFGDLDYSLSIKERCFGYREAIRTFPQVTSYADALQYIMEYSVLENLEQLVIEHDIDNIVLRVQHLRALPQAFVCSNDNAAIQLIHALQRLDCRVPEDVAVTGFDNSAISAAVLPRLTTVNVHKESMGRAAVQRLIWRLGHRNEPLESIVLNVEVVERDSIRKLCSK